MAHLPFHPAPGLGELLPGFFVVPQNPITAAVKGTQYIPHVGELLPASFSVPQNPIVKTFQTNMNGLGACPRGNCGGFTGALAGATLPGMSGLGEMDMSSFNPGNWSTATWALVAAGGIVLLMMSRPGKSAYQAAMAQARADYQKQVAGIRSKYRRVGQRIGKGAARFARKLADEE